jgi:hypothetical protein
METARIARDYRVALRLAGIAYWLATYPNLHFIPRERSLRRRPNLENGFHLDRMPQGLA